MHACECAQTLLQLLQKDLDTEKSASEHAHVQLDEAHAAKHAVENELTAAIRSLKSEKAQAEFQEQAAKTSCAQATDELKAHRQIAAQELKDAQAQHEAECEAMGQRIQQVLSCVVLVSCVCLSVVGPLRILVDAFIDAYTDIHL